jgi:hypothetical protein
VRAHPVIAYAYSPPVRPSVRELVKTFRLHSSKINEGTRERKSGFFPRATNQPIAFFGPALVIFPSSISSSFDDIKKNSPPFSPRYIIDPILTSFSRCYSVAIEKRLKQTELKLRAKPILK